MLKRAWYKASEAADYLRISYQTLRKYTLDGKIEHDSTPAGQRVYTQAQLDRFLGIDKPNDLKLAHYVRDSQGNQERLNRQKEKLVEAFGEPIKTYQDKASGLNENRKGLHRLIRDVRKGQFNAVAITAKDRLTRFGYLYLEELFDEYGCKILVLDDALTEKSAYDELIQDFMILIASFSGKYYKLRGIKHEKSHSYYRNNFRNINFIYSTYSIYLNTNI